MITQNNSVRSWWKKETARYSLRVITNKHAPGDLTNKMVEYSYHQGKEIYKSLGEHQPEEKYHLKSGKENKLIRQSICLEHRTIKMR